MKHEDFHREVAVIWKVDYLLAWNCKHIAIASVILAAGSGIDITTLEHRWVIIESWLKANPWAMFMALVFLPGLPIPMLVLLPLAGFAWNAGAHPIMAGLLMFSALALNMTWTYFFASYPAGGLMEGILKRTSFKIPTVPDEERLRLGGIMLEGPPPKVIWVRLGDIRRTDLESLLEKLWPAICDLLDSADLVEVHLTALEAIKRSEN